MSDELLPCPHCGSDKVLVIGMADKPLDCYRWHVECQECHCTGRRFYRAEGARREMAIAAWNRRVPAPGVPDHVRSVLHAALIVYITECRELDDPDGEMYARQAQQWLDSQYFEPEDEDWDE